MFHISWNDTLCNVTEVTAHTLIKTTFFCSEDTFVPYFVYTIQPQKSGHLTNQDTSFCPKGVQIRGVPLYIFALTAAPADPVLPRNNLDNCTYVLCTNSSSQKTILGRDLIIYKRAQENQSFEVFLTRTIIGQTWEDFLGYNIIEANDSGWRVFHLESLFGAHTNRHICVNIYVRVQNDTKFLSKERVKEIFALEPLFPHEQLYKPFSAVFINGTFNIPLLKKRSIDIPEITGNTTDCVLQKHIINLQNHLSTDVILPVETDLGNCVYQKSTQEKEVDEDSPLDPQYDGLQRCEPKEFDDLFVLVQDDTSLVLTSLPDFIITKCGTQPLGEVE